MEGMNNDVNAADESSGNVTRRNFIKGVIAAGAAVALLCIWSSAGAQQGNPFEADPAAIRAGRTLFEGRCAACHGVDARGAQGPDLTVLWMAGKSDTHVFDAVRRGVPNTVMPPSTAPDDEIWAIVAYLRSIGTVPPFTSARGDAVRGRTIFAAECASCHRAEGGGGAVGTDLSRIALPHSVRVHDLFATQALPTVWQMTSDVAARTRPGTTLTDVFAALFPCGSVTGAPKARAMQLIRELEAAPRAATAGSRAPARSRAG